MRLDPQAQLIADQLAAFPQPDLNTLTATMYRAAMAAARVVPPVLDPQINTRDLSLDCGRVSLPVRIFRPPVAGRLPVLVYFHGGGFIFGDLDTHDNICRRLAARAGIGVVSIDYRLAPEHPFPAAVDDAVAATRAVQARADEFELDGARLAVGGDSAGANLATVAARLLRGSETSIAHQLLIYPVTDAACDSPSQREFTNAPLLSTALMKWFWRQYLPSAADARDPRASPLLADDLAGLPPATLITAGYDPLRDEGQAYGEALSKAGVKVSARHWQGQFHGFASMLGALDAADEALDFAAGELRATWHD